MTIFNMPSDSSFMSVDIALEANTQSYTSPFNRVTQTLENPGARWRAMFAVTLQRGTDDNSDDLHGQWKGFLARLRGLANRFYGFDPAHRTPRGLIGKGAAAQSLASAPLYPNTNIYPSTSTYPTQDSMVVIAGLASCMVKTVHSTSCITVDGLQTWDYTEGANPLFEDGRPYFKPGDYIEIGSELKIIVAWSGDDVVNGESTIEYEPPSRTTVKVDQTVILTNPKCSMILVDDQQVAWSISPGQEYTFSFEGVEAFT